MEMETLSNREEAEFAESWYDIAPDGRFLMNGSPSQTQTPNFELLVNWPAKLTK